MQLYSSRFLLPVDRPPVEGGAILVEDGRIIAVGPHAELAAAHPGAAAVDFGDAVILPPMVNGHTHLELTHFPDWAAAADTGPAPNSFAGWISRLVQVRKTVSPEQVAASLADGLRSSLAAGVGAVGDILTSLNAALSFRGSPLHGTVFCEILGREQAQVAQRLDAIDLLTAAPCSAQLAWGVSPHAPYTLTAATAGQISRFAARRSLPMAMHLAETREEIDFLREGRGAIADLLYATANWQKPDQQNGGLRPVEWADRHDCLLPGNLVVHGVHVTPAEAELIARRRCSVVLCPRSNSLFGLQRAPVSMYRDAGVNLALGTDSRASAPSLSIWDELAFAQSWFRGTLDPSEWLAVATLGGARALGLERRFGCLSPAMDASFQVVAAPSGAGLGDLEEGLCNLGSKAGLDALYLSGQSVLPVKG